MSSHEESFGRRVIREVIGLPTSPAPSRFTYSDLIALRDKVIKLNATGQARCRLPGMIKDLTCHELIDLAYFEAAVEVLNRLGVIDRTKLDKVMPVSFAADHEVIVDQTYGTNMTQQKK